MLLNISSPHSKEWPIQTLLRSKRCLKRGVWEAVSESGSIDPFVWEKGAGVPVEDSPVPEADFSDMRTVALRSVEVIGQARNMYIIAQCDDGG